MKNRAVKTAAQILAILALHAALSIGAYEGGSVLAKSILAIGSGVTLLEWQAQYAGLVCCMGGLAAALSLLWYALARFGMRISYAQGTGRRGVWAAIGLLVAALAALLPYAYASRHDALQMSYRIPALFVALYALAGYWGGSLFLTPAAYKYTPLGASLLRARRRQEEF